MRLVAAGFALAIAGGTGLLLLPTSTAGPGGATFLQALFTATSAVCVTGLAVVDTGTHWSGSGQAVVLLLVQVGGLGIMTATSLVALLLFRRLGLRSRLLAQTEAGLPELGGLQALVRRVVLLALVVEAVVAVALALRFAVLGDPPATAAWRGVFHSVMAFNHAGFALFSDSFSSYALDEWLTVPVMVAVVLASLGFPVLFEVAREWRTPRLWSLHSKLTLLGTAVLVVAGTLGVAAVEWGNDGTLGELAVGDKLAVALFQSVNPRTAGFQSLDYAEAHPATLLLTDVLMFVGGGAASTSGGVGVATCLLLGAVLLAEARGDADVTTLGRRAPAGTVRQAFSISLLAVLAVVAGTAALTLLADVELGAALFEVTSALATVGLSAGVTATLPPGAQVLLVVLMYVGRLGPLAVATVLLAREARVRYRLPEERVLLG